jgi:prepilin-type N-terminal cleavage/methylation domain-containing protein
MNVNSRKGFTLMELLLVVAVLAIVAAAAAPTFFGGANAAMDEARRAAFLSAYTNTMSGASMMMSIASSRGVELTGDLSVNPTVAGATDLRLASYVPDLARTFTNPKNTSVVLKPVVNATTKTVEILTGATKVTPDIAGWNIVKELE